MNKEIVAAVLQDLLSQMQMKMGKEGPKSKEPYVEKLDGPKEDESEMMCESEDEEEGESEDDAFKRFFKGSKPPMATGITVDVMSMKKPSSMSESKPEQKSEKMSDGKKNMISELIKSKRLNRFA